MDANAEPRLAPPGAGLPKIELYIGRLIFAVRRRTGSREIFNARFASEREAIRRLVGSCPEAAATTRVLIKRPAGLEDSSRYWSVWMTLDHLRIVNQAVTKTISALARGVVPPGKAGTAGVKPRVEVTAAVVAEHEAACDSLLAAVAAIPDLKTPVRYAHPWFGPLDASGWHALAGTHMGLHRVQLERILEGLRAGGGPVRRDAAA